MISCPALIEPGEGCDKRPTLATEAARELEPPERMAQIKERMQDDSLFTAQVEKDLRHVQSWIRRFSGRRDFVTGP